MNDIIKPLSKDGMVGWDEFGQLWAWRKQDGGKVGTVIADTTKQKCFICLRGWEPTAESLLDQDMDTRRAAFAHQSCVIRLTAIQEFDFWCNALVDAGFMFGPGKDAMPTEPCLEHLENGYWRNDDPLGAGQPWYRAVLLRKDVIAWKNYPHGRSLKLGRRKRVYHMEIEAGNGHYDYAAANELFSKETVTKQIDSDRMYIHAWGQEKAKEYLKHFAKILNANAWREALSKERVKQ